MNPKQNKPMQRVTADDLVDAVTQAQRTVCLQQRRGAICPVCGGEKLHNLCLCQKCYFALPENMRAVLYMPRPKDATPAALDEWTEHYVAAKLYLRDMLGIGEDAIA